MRPPIFVIALTLISTATAAQEGPVTFEFSFSNPGARSLAFGGAFSALADDATAAFANPAGLVQLSAPEVSLEGRHWRHDTPFVTTGRANGEPTGEGIDVHEGLVSKRSSSDSTNVSYLSYVQPSGDWSLAAYRHVLADFSLSSQVNGLFGIEESEDEPDVFELDRSEDVLASTRFEVVNYGLAGAYSLTDGFSVGIGVAWFDAEMDSVSREYKVPQDQFFEANDFAPENLDTAYSLGGDSNGWTVQGGFLWRLHDSWSIGGHYRQGPELTIRAREVTGPADDEDPDGTVHLDRNTPLQLPDSYGLGVSYRTADQRLTLVFQWDRILYSSITEDLDTAVFDPGQITMSDGDEFHLGAEYVLADLRPIVALRFGTWIDPDHRVDSADDADVFESAIFQGGDDEWHVTAGIGLVLPTIQIDAAIDLSDNYDVYSLSMVRRF